MHWRLQRWGNVAPTYIAFDQQPQWRERAECIHTRVFHYRKIFHIIPTLLRLHKSMKLRFLPFLLFSFLSSNNIKIFYEGKKMLQQMRNLNFIFFFFLSPLSLPQTCKFAVRFYSRAFSVFFGGVKWRYIKDTAAKLNFYYVCTLKVHHHQMWTKKNRTSFWLVEMRRCREVFSYACRVFAFGFVVIMVFLKKQFIFIDFIYDA